MKKLFVFFPICAVLFSSCFKEGIRGSGAILSENRILNGTFDEIRVKGSMDLKLIQGDSIKIVASDYQNLLSHLVTRLEGNTLVLDYDDDLLWILNSDGIVTVTVPQLNKIKIEGSGDAYTSGNFNFNDVELAIHGSGSFGMAGKAKSLTAKVVGSGDIRTFALISKNTTASISGSGNIEVNVEQTLDATITGSGNIVYKGTPSVNSRITGSGSIRHYYKLDSNSIYNLPLSFKP